MSYPILMAKSIHLISYTNTSTVNNNLQSCDTISNTSQACKYVNTSEFNITDPILQKILAHTQYWNNDAFKEFFTNNAGYDLSLYVQQIQTQVGKYQFLIHQNPKNETTYISPSPPINQLNQNIYFQSDSDPSKEDIILTNLEQSYKITSIIPEFPANGDYYLYYYARVPLKTLIKGVFDIYLNDYQQDIVLLDLKKGSEKILYSSTLQTPSKVENYNENKLGISLASLKTLKNNFPIKEITQGPMSNTLLFSFFFKGELDRTTQFSHLDVFYEYQDTDSSFAILIYARKSKIFSTFEEISQLVVKHEQSTLLICGLTTVLTMSIVIIFTYFVAVQLARPLRKLINIANSLNNDQNNSFLEKKKKEEIFLKLDQLTRESRFQVKNIIISFKDLIEKIQMRNLHHKKHNKLKQLDFPLNQFDSEFTKKAITKSSKIDWNSVINEIENSEIDFENKNKKDK